MSQEDKKVLHIADYATRRDQDRPADAVRFEQEDRNATIYDISTGQKLFSKKSPRHFHHVAITMAAVAWCGVMGYQFSRESPLEQQIHSELRSIKQEYDYACSQRREDNDVLQLQRTAWINSRKDRVLEMYGCRPEAVQWSCIGEPSPNAIEKRSIFSNCPTTLRNPETTDLSEVVLGVGTWSYDSWLEQRRY